MTSLGRRRWWVLGALVVILLAVGLDLTALNVALPTLSAQLDAGTSALQWIVASYTLVSATLLIPAGLIGDRYGRKMTLLAGLALFLAGSLLATLVSSPAGLITARTLMGVGSAAITTLAMSVLLVVFPPEERPKALGAWAAASFLGLPLGPIIGGYLLDHFWWGSIFLINIPVSAVALVLGLILIPESRSSSAPRPDFAGLLLSTGGLVALVYGTIQEDEYGWSSPGVWGVMAAGAIMLVAFVAWTRRVVHPLVDLRLFADRRFTGGVLPATLLTFAMFGVLFVVPQYFQAVLGTTPMGSGLRLLPLIGGLIASSRLGAPLVTRIGPRLTIVAGTLPVIAGMLLGATTTAASGYGLAAAWLTVAGLGMGLILPASMNAAMSALSAEQAGVGSAVLMTVRLVGGAFGAAVLGSLLSSGYRGRVDVTGLPPAAAHTVRDRVGGGIAVAGRLHEARLLHAVRAAFTHGMDLTLLAGAGIMVIAALLALILLPRRGADEPAGNGQSTHEYVSA
ncbi:DHA2 family efflux MFS transporter permease subunit [Actinoallomurus soli]|uniref:DHA2 family efflux MFS transporter permease subunit n=1 Tax=Actinoallomurus soli TaxID=2952535 RepID=UPI002092BE8B|nr:DHA2 family efflux MFS transporter permease subunit [Actinoallomurus soli]MCO5972154.1 DHA2 family efflux MFS transporter permease subunit [Actinoallomurus soli]